MTPTPRLVPDAIREVSSLIQSEVFKWPAANSVTPRVMELCQRLNLIAREIDAAAAPADLAHPSRGVVDEAMVDRVAAAMTEFGWASGGEPDEFREDVRTALEVAQAAALPTGHVPVDMSDSAIGRIADQVYADLRANGYTGAQGGVWWNKAMFAAGVRHAALPAVPEGMVLVPTEVLDLYKFMVIAFTPMTSQQEQISISLENAKAAMLAAAPAQED